MKKTEAQLNETLNSWQILIRGLALVAAMGLAGCVDSDEDSVNSSDNVTTNSAADIAQESADNYDNNVNGLISGSTLESWIDDWEANRPSGISGDLVILQIHPGMARYTQDTDSNGTYEETNDLAYISPDEAGGVRVYSVDHNDLRMDRSNGVLTTRSMVADGPTIDGFLQDRQIDPTEDMIVFAVGQGGNFQAMKLGRGWYTMRYWGVEKEHLAVLNGGAQAVMAENYMGASASDLPSQPGDFSVRELEQDNTALQVTLEEMIQEASNASGDVFIWDARNIEQYNATEDPFQNGGSAQGHPNGAVELNYANLLVSDASQTPRFLYGYQDLSGDCPGDTDANDESIYALTDDADGTNDSDADPANGDCYYPSYAWRSKSELETAMNGGIINGAQFQDLNGALGSGNAYQDGQEVWTYCETTYRAMVTGFATVGILGLPTRFYDGAMVEWHTMSNAYDKFGNQLLPGDSPWRTDKNSVSFFKYNKQSLTEPRRIDDPYADNTNAIILADRAYKISGSGDSGGDDDDSGATLPPNPCGG
ncbi:hypothetical protein [Thiohalophilus sp.]|uniref:sulfurtransferase n=1 Tax=Thiohalophilus sp. TaxID=3028392 RepID=UPI002ACEA9DE|nr:hypothetical protein [Thiohalophilus sp.]MDZ7802489.1 hypothetical protein [Thiohalophilus sp.]